jgi:hypothetical protein
VGAGDGKAAEADRPIRIFARVGRQPLSSGMGVVAVVGPFDNK